MDVCPSFTSLTKCDANIYVVVGIPLQTSVDCGSETVQMFGLANALRCVHSLLTIFALLNVKSREIFNPEIPIAELPAVRYMRSVHNVGIERSWLRLRLQWGDNAVKTYLDGREQRIFDEDNPDDM